MIYLIIIYLCLFDVTKKNILNNKYELLWSSNTKITIWWQWPWNSKAQKFPMSFADSYSISTIKGGLQLPQVKYSALYCNVVQCSSIWSINCDVGLSVCLCHSALKGARKQLLTESQSLNIRPKKLCILISYLNCTRRYSPLLGLYF